MDGCFVVTSAGVLTVANSRCEASRHANAMDEWISLYLWLPLAFG
jgi:hypothetical protein